ncbi:hypothetical protein INT47_004249 [Mucor saturninus]|uniref:Uncharacterized protein n=1 Tax=Mucor saturninus TaxID=64648 RepID=A0A8H7V294_9FUNG|nr:hypothetical protein INT47_004249 [Mucor saturninus]
MEGVVSARLVPFRDLDKCVKGESVRLTGIWKKYDQDTQMAVMRYDTYEAEVDTALLSTLPAIGDIVQCIGEVIDEATFGMLRIQARIVRIVNTIELDLYERVVRLRNASTG